MSEYNDYYPTESDFPTADIEEIITKHDLLASDDLMHLARACWAECKIRNETKYIKKTYSEHTGGNMIVDIVQLKDGRILGISGDLINLYKSVEDIFEGEPLGSIDLTPILEDTKTYRVRLESLSIAEVFVEAESAEEAGKLAVRSTNADEFEYSGTQIISAEVYTYA